jgi:hypothetical protein
MLRHDKRKGLELARKLYQIPGCLKTLLCLNCRIDHAIRHGVPGKKRLIIYTYSGFVNDVPTCCLWVSGNSNPRRKQTGG